MYNAVQTILNEWNPAEIHPLLSDEYSPETSEIVSFMKEKDSVTSNILGQKIYDIFLRMFGPDIFICTIDDCNQIAGRILRE